MDNVLWCGEECWIVEGWQGFFLAMEVSYVISDYYLVNLFFLLLL